MRISGLNESSADTELVISELWDLGTTGLLEAGLGDSTMLAGFTSRLEADEAAKKLARRFDFSDEHLVVEPVPPIEHWQPPGQTTQIELVITGQDPLRFEIDAGPTFGHGRHPTTRLALDLMATAFDESRHEHGAKPSFLDVGTGSGILAIAGAKLGAQPVVAIDNDSNAVTMAARNAESNNVSIVASSASLAETAESHPGGFEVIAINVLLPVHAELAKGVLDNLVEHGLLITSGYLESQRHQLLQQYLPMGCVQEATIGDWAGHILQRR